MGPGQGGVTKLQGGDGKSETERYLFYHHDPLAFAFASDFDPDPIESGLPTLHLSVTVRHYQ